MGIGLHSLSSSSGGSQNSDTQKHHQTNNIAVTLVALPPPPPPLPLMIWVVNQAMNHQAIEHIGLTHDAAAAVAADDD